MTEGIPRQRADRTQLQQIIAGLPEGVIIINPDQTIAWSNEAALAMHEVKSLKELGGTVSEYRKRFELRYRNKHKLPPGEYPMDRVVAGEAFSEVVVEVARPGEEQHRVQQIRSLVINDPEGQPDCLVLIIEDQTERFSAEERFERMFGANPAPAIIARLSDMRYVKVNQGFMEMTGYVRGPLIGKSVHEFDVLEGAEKRDLAIECLHAGKTIPQMEAHLRLPNDNGKSVIVAGLPIETVRVLIEALSTVGAFLTTKKLPQSEAVRLSRSLHQLGPLVSAERVQPQPRPTSSRFRRSSAALSG